MYSFPEELYHEILSRVPARSTYLCKCVCKTWLKLISHPSFVKFHLSFSIQENNPSLIINSRDRKVIYSTSYQSLLSSSSTEDLCNNSVELDYPFKQTHYVQLAGSCNGLVCLDLISSDRLWKLFCLWNPATTEYKTIPIPEVPNLLVGACAFGYDTKLDDYMIANYDSTWMEMVVYTLGSDSWKIILTDRHKLHSAIFVNGALHWLAERRGQDMSKVIISLDINNEKLVESLQLPKEVKENKNMFMSAGVLGECLSVLVKLYTGRWEVWVMHNNGVLESWTKRYVIPHDKFNNASYLKVMRYYKDGVLFWADHKMVLYDTVHEVVRETQFFNIDEYVESLVPLKSHTYMIERENC